jgi:dolichol-phosphate mannosyltransferase
MLACGVGAVPNIGIATYLMESHATWAVAGLAGALVSAVWNYAAIRLSTGSWR